MNTLSYNVYQIARAVPICQEDNVAAHRISLEDFPLWTGQCYLKLSCNRVCGCDVLHFRTIISSAADRSVSVPKMLPSLAKLTSNRNADFNQ